MNNILKRIGLGLISSLVIGYLLLFGQVLFEVAAEIKSISVKIETLSSRIDNIQSQVNDFKEFLSKVPTEKEINLTITNAILPLKGEIENLNRRIETLESTNQ